MDIKTNRINTYDAATNAKPTLYDDGHLPFISFKLRKYAA